MLAALQVLQRVEGAPQFKWVQELIPMINDRFQLADEHESEMSFDTNHDYSGSEFITPLFNAILRVEKQCAIKPKSTLF